MRNYDVNAITVRDSQTILDVLRNINDSAAGFALVVDGSGRLAGIVTDGDIRRGILNGCAVQESVKRVLNTSPVVAHEGQSREEMFALLNDKISRVPVVGKDGKVKSILSIKDRNMAVDVKSRTVCVLGLGYVGLTVAVVLADIGFKVYGYDVDPRIVGRLRKGDCHFYENGLDTYLNQNLGVRLFPVGDLEKIEADIYIIAVGTPVEGPAKQPILRYLESAAECAGKRLKPGDLVALRSTVPVGTTRDVVLPILNKHSGLQAGTDYSLCFAPERTAEGCAISELRKLPQIIGGYDRESALLASRVFGEMTSTIIDVGSLEGAEMVKILNNTFRDVVFAYANEMALICRDRGLDMHQLVEAANDNYERNRIPVPSPGVGGPCLTKDAYLLRYSCESRDVQPTIVNLCRTVNESIPAQLAREIDEWLKHTGKKTAKIFLIGFAFKGEPETSDTRGSTTLTLLDELGTLGYPASGISGYDAVAGPDALKDLGVLPATLQDGFRDADVVAIMNNHKSLKRMDIFKLLATTGKPCLFLDGWRTFDPADIKGLEHVVYLGVGCK